MTGSSACAFLLRLLQLLLSKCEPGLKLRVIPEGTWGGTDLKWAVNERRLRGNAIIRPFNKSFENDLAHSVERNNP